MEGITTAFTSGVTSIVADCTSLIEGVLPVALPLLGLSIAVVFGIKFVKKITKG